jgi:hypothetical protein
MDRIQGFKVGLWLRGTAGIRQYALFLTQGPHVAYFHSYRCQLCSRFKLNLGQRTHFQKIALNFILIFKYHCGSKGGRGDREDWGGGGGEGGVH